MPPEFELAIRFGFRVLHDLVNLPVLVLALMANKRIHPAYGMTPGRKFQLAWRMYRNSFRVFSASTWKAHLAMAVKLLEIDPAVEGVVVECGCFKGGSAVNLSLACDIVGRDLILYDSFDGLPAPREGERYGTPEAEGGFRGSLEEVQQNIQKGGAIDRCIFRKGWFEETLPHHSEPIVLAYWDVDYQASLHECLINLWPHVIDHGHVFIDEYLLVDYCSAFFSERFWRENFDTIPPGLYGTGTGVPLGQYYLGPFMGVPLFQDPSSIAYTFKGSTGFWDYYPQDIAKQREDVGGDVANG